MTTEAVPAPSGQVLPRLGLHVINAGYGESIVLEMPGDRWGVVDCYSPDLRKPASNPTLQFLRERSVKRLEFLALTHPHEDHYQGLKDLLDHLQVSAFWWFAGISPPELPRFVNGLREETSGTKTKDRSRQRSVRNLDQLFLTMIKQREAKTLVSTQMSDFKTLYPLPLGGTHGSDAVQIHTLAPWTDTVQRYQEELYKCFASEHLKQKMATLKHNQISAALLVEFGETRLILGGDVEEASWKEALSQIEHTRLNAHAVKVSHHGSRNGYCTGLWPLFCAGGKTVAIITPSHPHSLPNEDAVTHIRDYTTQIVSTCTPALTFSTTPSFDSWEAYDAGVQLSLRAVFPTFRAEKPFATGICSFWFDTEGQVIDSHLTEPATIL